MCVSPSKAHSAMLLSLWMSTARAALHPAKGVGVGSCDDKPLHLRMTRPWELTKSPLVLLAPCGGDRLCCMRLHGHIWHRGRSKSQPAPTAAFSRDSLYGDRLKDKLGKKARPAITQIILNLIMFWEIKNHPMQGCSNYGPRTNCGQQSVWNCTASRIISSQ